MGNQSVQVIAVTGGKGGVGKTNVSVNLALALAELGRRVVLMDADLGLANVDVQLGLRPNATIADVLAGNCSLRDVLVTGSTAEFARLRGVDLAALARRSSTVFAHHLSACGNRASRHRELLTGQTAAASSRTDSAPARVASASARVASAFARVASAAASAESSAIRRILSAAPRADQFVAAELTGFG